MRSRYEAMIFDMDGTLLNSMFYWRTIWHEYIDEHGLIMPQELKDKVIFGCGKACELIARDNGLDRNVIYRAMLEELLARHYARDVLPKPFARELLQKLREEGRRVIVATATPRHMAESALARHDMLKYLDFVTDAEEMGASKADRQFFLNVARRLGLEPERCLMFEDAVYAVRSAKAAGMAVWAIDEPLSWPDREEIRSLADRYLMSWAELTAGALPG